MREPVAKIAIHPGAGYGTQQGHEDHKRAGSYRLEVSDGRKAVEDILDAFKTIISLQRDLLSLSTDAGDEGTNALMSDYIRTQEKLVWMYSAFLNKG